MVESSEMNTFWWLYIEWYLLCEQFVSVPFWTTLSVVASQKVGLLALKNEKCIFLWNMSKSLVGNIVCHATMRTCAKFGHISTNYVMNVAKTLLVSLENYECLFMIASFWEHVFNKTYELQVYIFFMVTRSHVMTLREDFSLFRFFLNFVCLFENLVEVSVMTVRV